jgi:hypothetical protein
MHFIIQCWWSATRYRGRMKPNAFRVRHFRGPCSGWSRTDISFSSSPWSLKGRWSPPQAHLPRRSDFSIYGPSPSSPILANLIPDLIYYSIGYWGREQLALKYRPLVWASPKPGSLVAEKLIEKHAGKSLIAIKLIPLARNSGTDRRRVSRAWSVKKFVWWSVIITIPSSALYLVLGYYFGAGIRPD